MKIYRVLADNDPTTRAGDYDYDTAMCVYIRPPQGTGHSDDALVRKLFYATFSADAWVIRDILEVTTEMFGATSWEIEG